ncbi:hypothetical protein GCM10008967_36210 [Bacillus carboniphilus]|uniref:Uncharacterized protein n=1 Tax=Bacillus carboniphilus TaxID=86663 RepID=A0ABP3GD01_9BACI
MFAAWLITIFLFVICLYFTIVIINGLKEKDEHELVQLKIQFQNLDQKNELKQVI